MQGDKASCLFNLIHPSQAIKPQMTSTAFKIEEEEESRVDIG